VTADRAIRVLPRSAAERIAAGEVVERPASVVKELVENSLDAGARNIVVEIEDAGRRLIRVVDDGEGIAARDLPLAFERFATSKIRSAADLHQILTYGFRGEALPSIAAVARVEMVTRPPNDGEAARIVVVGGTRDFLGPASGPPGTTVTVEDLYFNTPARREFLKSPAREFAVIVETVQALALAAPGVSFRLVEGGREAMWYPPEGFAARARRVLGPHVAGQTFELASNRGITELTGVFGTPQVAQRRRSHQWFLVNGRPVRSLLLARALAQAFHTLIPEDRHPAAVLSVRVPPGEVDANVHPRKTEVRFMRERPLADEVVREVRRALHSVPLPHIVPADPRAGSRARGPDTTPEPEYPVPRTSGPGAVAEALRPPGDETETLWSGAGAPSPLWPSIRLIGQLGLTYVVGEADGDLILIDQHAAHERVLYEQLLARRATEGARAQVLALPAVVDLTPVEAALLRELGPALGALGFEMEPFGPDTIRLTAVPAIAAGRAAEELFRACLRDVGDDEIPWAGRTLEERLAIATACHTAIRAGDRMDPPTMTALLGALERAEDPYSCFHGRPTLVRVRGAELERWFYRRG